MKRLLLSLAVFALLSFASCKSESKSETANPTQPAATLGTEATPPPGSVEISEATLQKDAQQNPDDPTAHFNLGGMYLAEGKYAEAAEEFKFVTAKNPKDVDALARLGIADAALNKFDEAIDAFKRAAVLSPQNADLHKALADAYEKAGRQTEAARERAEFERLQPNEHAKELYKQGKYEETVVELQKLSNKNAETYLVQGNALLKLNQPKEAADAFRQAVRMNPQYADAYFQLGNACDRLNQQEDAAKAFQEAVRLNPQDADAFFNLGNTYGKLGRDSEAADAYAQAVRLNPQDADARFRLALLRLKGGDVRAASEQYEALKGINPQTAEKLRQIIGQSAPSK
ncbi:MAG TPA: tetratricopeptide repeat protein [Pyrinomonadaceae bacterium]|nr:tetratricopeptide repeat protein [Pyrinomonadaceae bacterium]